jgi:hypothetical protein
VKLSSLSLAVTALYVLLTVNALETARALGPMYAATVLALFLLARPWRCWNRG